MKEKRTRRWLSLLLTAVMVLSLIPATVLSASAADVEYKIVHLDCGRKYFSVDWVKALIHEIKADGYTHLELAFGNDGLRFLLDDMSVDADGDGTAEYSSTAVTSAIQSGNKAYYDAGTKNEWTQAEMDAIIACAEEVGIEIIPLLNTPGHMDAIVSAMGTLGISNAGYNSSKTTVDLSNTTAVNFTKTLVKKYAGYFKAQGCTIFNMGCDEYANDIYTTGSMGFGNLVSTGKYGNFITYVNELAAIVKGVGMTPMAFNDGFYFNGNTISGTFDTDIMIAFWTSGWDGYRSETAAQLADRGNAMINTNGDYYYVLGKNDAFTPGDTTTHDPDLYTAASTFSNTTFMGSTVSNPAGSMFCIWCDYPGAETETQIAENARLVMRAMAARMDDKSIDNLDTSVVANGFNADGTINTASSGGDTGDTTEYDEEIVLEVGESKTKKDTTGNYENNYDDDDLDISIATVDVTGKDAVEGTAVYSPAYSIASVTCNTLIGSNNSNWTAVSGYYYKADDGNYYPLYAKRSRSGSIGNRTYTYTWGYSTTDSSNNVTQVSTQSTKDTNATPNITVYIAPTCNSLISSDNNSWVAVSGYYYKADDGKYYQLYAKRSSEWSWSSFATTYTYTWGYSAASSSSNVIQIGTQSTTDTSTTANISVYTKSGTEGTPASTTIIFTGVAPGTTYVTVGNTTYKVVVKHKEDTVNIVLTEGSVTKTQSKEITGEPEIEDPSIVAVAVDGKNVTFTGLNVGKTTVTVGDTIYTVNVSEVDLSNVGNLTIEYWITNKRVEIPYNSETTSSTITADISGIYSESGVDVTSLIPADNGDPENLKVLWKVVCLPAGKHQAESGDDMTGSPDAQSVLKIRYWGQTWSFYDGENWVAFNSTDQIVAYYMQRTNVTSEVTTDVTDWGQDYAEWKEGTDNRWFWTGYVENGSKYVFLDLAVVYEDGTQNPSSFPTDNTWFFHFDGCSATNPRVLGRMTFTGSDEYEIWKVTVTDGTSTGYSSYLTFTPSYDNDTETVVWDESMGGTPEIASLSYTTNRSGKLVRIYVRTKVTEDNLTVHYMDRTANNAEFYSYGISVKSGTTFDENFALVENYTDIANALTGNTVKNSLNVTQTVTADLGKMSEIGAQYRYSSYTCVEVKLSTDKKDVYLYYDFSNTHNFVIDFGLPLTLTASDLGVNGDWTNATVAGAQYGEATVQVGGGLTYTPTKVLTGTESLQLTLANGTDNVTHQIYIIPASNVLYEDSFLTVNPKISYDETYLEWKTVRTDTADSNAQTSDQETRYGYDIAYANSTNYSQGTSWSITGLTSSTTSRYLTTSFYGTGFDLIGTAGPNTGNVYLLIQGPVNKLIIVDTSYVDGGVTLYQVPMAHVEGLTEGLYTVNILAGYRAASGGSNDGSDSGSNSSGSTRAAYSLSSESSAIDDIYAVVDKLLMDGLDFDDVEFVYFDGNSPLAELDNSRATYVLDTGDSNGSSITGTTVPRPEGNMITIDGFRVYGDTAKDAYTAEGEYGATYTNVLDAMLNNDNGSFTAYAENQTTSEWTQANYEGNGGPQNEVYLAQGHAIVFKVNAGATVQISSRAAKGTPNLIVNGTVIVPNLVSNTEMYYNVTATYDGIVTIQNGVADSLLALGNLKMSTDIQVMPLSLEDEVTVFTLLRMAPAPGEPEVPEEPEETEVFTPEKLNVSVKSFNVIRNKLVTVTVNASTDVEKLTINGQTVKPMNSLLVKRGWSKEYIYVFTDTVKRGESKSYEIVAYDADGLASEPKSVTG